MAPAAQVDQRRVQQAAKAVGRIIGRQQGPLERRQAPAFVRLVNPGQIVLLPRPGRSRARLLRRQQEHRFGAGFHVEQAGQLRIARQQRVQRQPQAGAIERAMEVQAGEGVVIARLPAELGME